jgi:transcriptional regulator with XRE-family HTH domain
VQICFESKIKFCKVFFCAKLNFFPKAACIGKYKIFLSIALSMTNFTQRLLAVRGDMAQKDFAKKLGINPNTLRAYENGRSLPNQDKLAEICVKFSVSPTWLLLGTGTMHAGETENISINPERLKLAIVAVERCLSETNRQMNAENKAELILAIYSVIIKNEISDISKIIFLMNTLA